MSSPLSSQLIENTESVYQPPVEKRALALDALRGIAILGMILSSRIPFGSLPGWMYHAQNPPPSHQFNPLLPGISWVDLVFPLFLFAMGAAFPFALSKKLNSGIPVWKISASVLKRGLLLAAFAIFIQHLRPTVINLSPDTLINLISLSGFIFLFLIYVRFPEKMHLRMRYSLKAAGVIGLSGLLIFIRYPDGSGFSLYRSDIIILVLANVAVSGSLIWIFTRNNIFMRAGLLVILIALRLSANIDGSWVSYLWNEFQISWLFKLYYHQYLFIVIPGTIAGDLILKWLSRANNLKISENKNSVKPFIEAAVLVLYMSFVTAGLYSRYVLSTVVVTALFSFAGYFYYKDKDDLYRELFNLFIYLMAAGLIFEAFEGGIQKGRPTLSFYFVTSALSFILLMAFSLLIYSTKFRMKLLVNNGQNPMLAYAGGTNLLSPFVSLFFIDILVSKIALTPWLGALKGLLLTLLLAFVVDYFTRKKIYWRT
jgi:hypothetical protein